MSDALVWTVWETFGPNVGADPEVCGGRVVLAGTDFTLARLLGELADGGGPAELAGKFSLPIEAIYNVLRTLAGALDHPAVRLVRCVHGAAPKMCAFAGCPHFVPDGPRNERWAFADGTTEDDIRAAMHENEMQHARVPGSASPIHLVVHRKMQARIYTRPLDAMMMDDDGC